MPVITISRQFGAAGVPIGRALADRFGAEFLDRAIIAVAAVRAGVPESELESYDERLPTLWQRVASALASSTPEPALPSLPYTDHIQPMSMHDRLVAITRAVIEEAAERGNAVIVGRGGAFILGRRPGVLHVQLHASIAARVHNLLSHVEEIPPEARPEEKSLRELCRSIDAVRADYLRRLYSVDWLNATHYDLALDTGRLGISRSVDVIESVVRGLPDADEQPPR